MCTLVVDSFVFKQEEYLKKESIIVKNSALALQNKSNIPFLIVVRLRIFLIDLI